MLSNSSDSPENDLLQLADPVRAGHSRRFFKTGPGEYGEGDQFFGIPVPKTRVLVRKYRDLPLDGVSRLLKSPIHEARLMGALILVDQFQRKKGAPVTQQALAEFYLAHLDCFNNWDIIDSSAGQIVGAYFSAFPDTFKRYLNQWAASPNVWHRRIAMLATFYEIRQHKFDNALAVAEALVNDKHDLVQKAVGWMLREIGKCDLPVEIRFLDRFSATMPRTMLRYAIEKFSPVRRKYYLTR